MNQAIAMQTATEPEECELEPAPSASPLEALPKRSIRAIIADLSKPIKPRHLKKKMRGGQVLDFIPWYHAVKYLDLHAPGWSYEVRNTVWGIAQIYILAPRKCHDSVQKRLVCLPPLLIRHPDSIDRMRGSAQN